MVHETVQEDLATTTVLKRSFGPVARARPHFTPASPRRIIEQAAVGVGDLRLGPLDSN